MNAIIIISTILIFLFLFKIYQNKKLTNKLKLSEEKFRGMFQNVSSPRFLIDSSNTNIIEVNNAASEFYGYPIDIFKTMTLNDINVSSAEEVKRKVEKAAKNKKTHLNLKHILASGEIRDVEVYISPININGKTLLYSSVHDITKQKIDEKELKLKKEELELKNEELIKANHEKDLFFSIIAHDLKTPFNGLLGVTELMIDDTLTCEEIKEFSILLNKSAHNTFELIVELLEWAKIQRGLTEFNPSIINLNETINKTIQILNLSILNKSIKLFVDVPNDHNALVDQNMIQTVFRNLISNAIKFTTPNGKIIISSEIIEHNIRISIKDNGIGMSDKIKNNLFNIEVNTKRIGTDGEHSNGLGLILCKDLIKKQGGKIWVESEEEKGSTFYFTIPNVI